MTVTDAPTEFVAPPAAPPEAALVVPFVVAEGGPQKFAVAVHVPTALQVFADPQTPVVVVPME